MLSKVCVVTVKLHDYGISGLQTLIYVCPNYMQDKLLIEYQRVSSIAAAETKDIQSVINWMEGNRPLVPAESSFLNG